MFPALDLMWFGKNVSSEAKILDVHQYLALSSMAFSLFSRYFVEIYSAFFFILFFLDNPAQG